MADDWPFTDPENLAVFTLARVVRGESPILRVTHDEDDGGWQFTDGARSPAGRRPSSRSAPSPGWTPASSNWPTSPSAGSPPVLHPASRGSGLPP